MNLTELIIIFKIFCSFRTKKISLTSIFLCQHQEMFSTKIFVFIFRKITLNLLKINDEALIVNCFNDVITLKELLFHFKFFLKKIIL